MERSRTKPEHDVPDPASADQVRIELASVLDSAVFRTSKRCHDFLLYVVTRTLQGDSHSLRERTLAVEVFGRKTDAALGDDSIVRVGAREVRKRLAQYYMTEGSEAAIRIDLPPGSYVPVFHAPPSKPVNSVPTAAASTLDRPMVVADGAGSMAAALPVRPASSAGPIAGELGWMASQRKWLVLGSVLVLALAGALLWRFERPSVPEEFNAFWRPAFLASGPVFLGMAHPIVYHPSNRLIRLDEEANGTTVLQRQTHAAPDPKANDYVPVFDQYVGFGDAMAASRLSILFAQHQRLMTVRLADRLNFADLRDAAIILIGAFTNRWATELVQGLRYRFQSSLGVPWILNSATGKKWLLAGKKEDGLANEDYILICRLTRAQTGGFVIIAAGLTEYGTEEAGRILSDPDSLTPLLRKMTPDWRNKNLQLVLHSRVLGETSTTPDLIASYVW